MWKQAAAVILINKSKTALQHGSTHKFNYKILMLERSTKSQFMPNAYVFPGGKVSKRDFNNEWQLLLQDDISTIPFTRLVHDSQHINRSPMLTAHSLTSVKSNIAYRICGVRETFEESGILMQKSAAGSSNPAYSKILHDWRLSINKDDSKFIAMFNDLKITPDICSLHEWNNWLTPTHLAKTHGSRRFDTIFYMAFMEKFIEANHDDEEIIASKWYHPVDLIKEYQEEKIWMVAPQLYLLHQLFNPGMGDFDNLKDFAEKRELQSCERWMPVRQECADGILEFLPGDDFYPSKDDLDVQGTRPAVTHKFTIDEAREMSANYHRLEFRTLYDCTVRCNICLPCGHVRPVTNLVV